MLWTHRPWVSNGVSAMLRSAIVWLDRKTVQRFSGEAVSALLDMLAPADICIMTTQGRQQLSQHACYSELFEIYMQQ